MALKHLFYDEDCLVPLCEWKGESFLITISDEEITDCQYCINIFKEKLKKQKSKVIKVESCFYPIVCPYAKKEKSCEFYPCNYNQFEENRFQCAIRGIHQLCPLDDE